MALYAGLGRNACARKTCRRGFSLGKKGIILTVTVLVRIRGRGETREDEARIQVRRSHRLRLS
jgi:hypothetical protein